MPNRIIVANESIRTPRRSPDTLRHPERAGVGQLKYPAAMRAFTELALRAMPGFPASSVFELLPNTILEKAKAKLVSVGVADFNQVGDFRLEKNLMLDRGGLVARRSFVQSLVSTMGTAQPGLEMHSLGGLNNHLDLLSVDLPFWPQSEAVIIADELDLRNKTITIDRNKVSHLWIIARRIRADAGACVTYYPLSNPALANKGPDGAPNPGSPNYDPGQRQSSSGHHANNGGAGAYGSDGGVGPSGLAAPDVTICVLEIDSMPDIVLRGQRGARGGTGGTGANGGCGQRGRDSKVKKVAGVPVDCSHGPGYGGHGGRGGDGGKGGRGGNGGDGGDVTIATLADQITSLVTARPFILDIGGGAGGAAGLQGAPGAGGTGGKAGYRTGWPCKEEPDRNGDGGLPGQRRGDLGTGDIGDPGTLSYEIITRDDWELLLERPWIMSLEPTSGFAGSQVVVHGLHFVNGSRIRVGSALINANFNFDRQLTFRMPENLAGRSYSIKVQTPDGDLSNDASWQVRPFISEIRKDGELTQKVSAGDSIKVVGRSFLSGAGLYSNAEALRCQVLSNTEIAFTVPSVVGEDGGAEMRLEVRNPDGQLSNEFVLKRVPSLDSGFRAAVHGYSFSNFRVGSDGWGAFCDTYSADEVGGNMLIRPLLTGAFYLFFEWFLTGGGAHCTGMATTALRKYHQNPNAGTFLKGPVSSDDPPPISDSQMRELDVAQGRLLSEELLVHYAEQGREGVGRVERTIREIEEDLKDGFGENSARVLSFVPSGSVWAAFSSEEYRAAFMDSHCVIPTRLVYPDATRSLAGAKLYIYDSNYPGDDTRYLDLFDQNGVIHFCYKTGPHEFSTATGFTLGTAKLRQHLIDDVDLPFSVNFIVDILLSPAHISVQSGDGSTLGYKDGMIHSDPELGYVCPWLETMVLVKGDAQVTRKITGRGTGTYTYASIHPAGKSFLIKDASCTVDTEDLVLISRDFSRIEITAKETKQFSIHLGERMRDGVTRYLNIAHDIVGNETTLMEVAGGMEGLTLHTPSRDVDVIVKSTLFDGPTLVEERELKVRVPAGKKMTLPAGMWLDIRGFGVSVQ